MISDTTKSSPDPQPILARVELPDWAEKLVSPARYKVSYGGRGGSKSYTYARVLLTMARSRRLRILCTRELQNSIADSVHRLLESQIEVLGYRKLFDVKNTSIKAWNGSEFTFEGLRNNVTKIKSMEGIDICWCEEAEKISDHSWETLIPTIRNPGSEIWVSFNPDEETDPTYSRFITNTPPDTQLIPVSWRDNPWFPDVLERERQYLKRVDPDAYEHVWEGKCRVRSKAQVLFGKWREDYFAPDPAYWHGPYFGADWGFAQDPTVLVKVWVHHRRLYIEHETWDIALDLDKTPARFSEIPGAENHVIRSDCARPETISHMQSHGYPKITAAPKWPGSVEDGIAHLRQYEEIVIHPRCRKAIEEARAWRYKEDRLTGDVLPVLVPGNDNIWDAVRYALSPLIRQGIFDDCDLS